MTRVILFLVLVMVLGFAFSWFADRPGDVTLAWQGTRYQTSLMVVISGFVGLVAFMMTGWWIIATILRSPALMRRFFRNRQRDRGYNALSQGLIAASSGDARQARRLAKDSRKLLGDEALVQLLDAQTLQLEGDRAGARERYAKMLGDDATKLVALRGLYDEAEREGEKEAAQHYAGEAAKLSKSLPWAGNALLKYQSLAGDWEAALQTLESNRTVAMLTRAQAERKRAVLLTAQARAEETAAPQKTVKLALQALKLAPTLTPAAVTGASALARTGDLKRAGRMLEDAWRKLPHAEIAQAYIALQSGDSASERLARARRLAALQPDHPESLFIVAASASAAKDWDAARQAAKTLFDSAPTQRSCLLMADIEQGQNGDKGRMRDWLSRAVRAPRDAAWTAEGMISDQWLPVSPASGEIDAFEWKAPVQALGMSIENSATLFAENLDDDLIAPAESGEFIDTEAADLKLQDGSPEPVGTADVPPREISFPAAPDDPGIDPIEAAGDRKTFRLF